MRTAILGVLLFTAMICTTAADITAQDKKVEPKSNKMPPDKPFTEWVTLRTWEPIGKKFLEAHPNIPMMWPTDDSGKPKKDEKGRVMVALGEGVDMQTTGPKSEITDRSGKTWVLVSTVTFDFNTRVRLYSVEPKAKDKDK